jgi:hypothetical protein
MARFVGEFDERVALFKRHPANLADVGVEVERVFLRIRQSDGFDREPTRLCQVE